MPRSSADPDKKFDYQQALRDVARSMVRLKKPDRLLKMITRFVDREFGLHHTSLAVFDPKKDRYVFANSKGMSRVPMGLIKFDTDHPLIRWFTDQNRHHLFQEDYLEIQEVKRTLDKAHFRLASNSKAGDLKSVVRVMETLKVSLVIPGYFKDSLIGVLLLGAKKIPAPFRKEEIFFFQTLAQDCSMAVKTAEYNQNLIEKNKELETRLQEIEDMRHKEQRTYYEIIRSLAQEVYAKEPYTFGHVEEVEKLGLLTAIELGLELSGRDKDILSAALILHDVGKIGIPDHILTKPGPLTPAEWTVMKTHVEKGARILEPLSDFKKVKEIIMSHHERYDGKGYPRKLKGEGILIEARILTVVDSFHAIVSSRCYHEGKSIDEAFNELDACSGTQFDPAVVKAFVRVLKREISKGTIDVDSLKHD